jgi:hypothetical protein
MNDCRVYWGSHGCRLKRGHTGPHLCYCADDPPEGDVINVGGPPYYGPETVFYGEDSGGLRHSSDDPIPPFAGAFVSTRPVATANPIMRVRQRRST